MYNTAKPRSLQHFYSIPAIFVDIIVFIFCRKVIFIKTDGENYRIFPSFGAFTSYKALILRLAWADVAR